MQLSFFDTIRISRMRRIHFMIPLIYGFLTVYLFLIPSKSIYYLAKAFIPRQNHPNISIFLEWSWLNNSSPTQRFSRFGIPTKYQYLADTTILILTCRLCDAIIDIDTMHITYIPDQHWSEPKKKTKIATNFTSILYWGRS